jgi:hypothetical protein
MKCQVTIERNLLKHVPECRYRIHALQDFGKFYRLGPLFQQNVDIPSRFHLRGKTRNKSKK